VPWKGEKGSAYRPTWRQQVECHPGPRSQRAGGPDDHTISLGTVVGVPRADDDVTVR
jgi:hypothetical protein